jgi:hypothetical protein
VNNVLPEIVFVLVLHVLIKLLIKLIASNFVNKLKVSDETNDFKLSLISVPIVRFFEFVDKSGFNWYNYIVPEKTS